MLEADPGYRPGFAPHPKGEGHFAFCQGFFQLSFGVDKRARIPHTRDMDIQNITGRFSTTTRVTVRSIVPGTPDSAIADFAMTAANESRSSLFGWRIIRPMDDPFHAVVELHKD